MRRAAAYLAAMVALLPGHGMAWAGGTQTTVLELFTSQGCSSCPPADVLFATYAKRRDLVALSMSVDYWDYLGWKDTLANPRFAARQRAYARSLGTGNVYTPQIVAGGTEQAIGSKQGQVDAAIDGARRASALISVDVIAQLTPNGIAISVGSLVSGGGGPNKLTTLGVKQAAEPPGGANGTTAASGSATTVSKAATVWFAVVSPKVDVTIRRGENKGRKLAYHNVVRSLTPVGMYSGQAIKLALTSTAAEGDATECAVFIQEGEAGRIIGAAWMKR